MVSNALIISFCSLMTVCTFYCVPAAKQNSIKTDIKPAVVTGQKQVVKKEVQEKKAPIKVVKSEQPTIPDVAVKPTEKKRIRLSAVDRRKRKSLNKVKRHTMRDMSYEELKEHLQQKLAQDDIQGAIRYAEKMVPMCQDMHELRDLSLELADLLFKVGEIEKAGKLYTEFAKLYPGNDKVEYAYYRAITCAFSAILAPTRDQTKTKETLELAHAYLERADVFIEHKDEIKQIAYKCVERLTESEFGVIEFYLKRGNFKAVQNRIDGLRKDFGLQMLALEPRLLTLEVNLALKQNNNDLHLLKLAELEKRFPEYSATSVLIAQADVKKPFSDRF